MNKVKIVIKIFTMNLILLVGLLFDLTAGDAPPIIPPVAAPSPAVSADKKEKVTAPKKKVDQKKPVIADKKAAADKKEKAAADEKVVADKKVEVAKKEDAAVKEKAAADKKVVADKKVEVAKKEDAAVKEKAEKKVSAEPAPPTQEAATTDRKPLPTISDIDTVDIEEGGNWLLKRKALEDTVDIIEQTNVLFSKLLEASTNFKIKRNKIDSEFDTFLFTIGFDLGDAEQLLSNLLDDLEEERKDLGDLTADERAAIASINEKKNEIKQLQLDIKALTGLDDEIDNVLATVDNQIKTANNYQGEAWKNFQAIKKVLSDEKAEDLYYRTEGLFKSMQDIYTYLTSTLSTYFNGQMQTMRNQMNKIKSTLQSLQQKGVDLRQQVDQFEKDDEEREKARLIQEQEEVLKKALAEAKKQDVTWMQSIMRVITYPFKQVKILWNYLYSSVSGWFTKAPKKTEVTDQQQAAMPEKTVPVDQQLPPVGAEKQPPAEDQKTEPVPTKS